MPDWFYRTVSRRLLYGLDPQRARSFALGLMGRLARLPMGKLTIDLLGHMRADPRLATKLLGLEFSSPVGLGPGLDVEAVALPALARFGVGFLTVGPIGIVEPAKSLHVTREDDREVIGFPDGTLHLGLETARQRLGEAAKLGVALVVRIAPNRPQESRELTANVATYARIISVPYKDAEQAVSAAGGVPVLAEFGTMVPKDPLVTHAELALATGAEGVMLTGELETAAGGIEIGTPARERVLAQAKALRNRFGPELPIIVAGGVHEPDHALDLLNAGANLVGIDSGLVFNGPGLVKRANDVVLYRKLEGHGPSKEEQSRPAEMTWFWTMLMGVGMLVGSVLAMAIAATRVVMPYDEAFLGMNREQLSEVNPRLLAFMAHDRVSLAGTMIAIGIMYVGLSVFGIRRGMHWAMLAVLISAFVGFASFFLFLGFGYLDTLHAFVTACLLQLLLLGVHSKLGPYRPDVPPALGSGPDWLRAQWGQFLLVLHAVGVIGAGLVISSVGISSVFVPEDLEFMHTTVEQLRAANPRLVPLVAHDRATFGGMLVSTGLVTLFAALWGIRAGSTWLWWTFLAAGLAAYIPAIGVHFVVGYDDWFHLLPASGGLALLLTGLLLVKPYLRKSAQHLRAEWSVCTSS